MKASVTTQEPVATLPDWLRHLSDEDLGFVKRFVLASGSLKEMARAYGVSYPTVRLRLDRLIAKIQVAEDHQIASPFERAARAQLADGRIDAATFSLLLKAHHEELQTHHQALLAESRGQGEIQHVDNQSEPSLGG